MGEFLLDGSLCLIKGVFLIVIQVCKEKFKGIIFLKVNVCEVVIVNDIKVYGVNSLQEVVYFLDGQFDLKFIFVEICDEFVVQVG